MPRPYRVGERQTQIALLVDHRVRLSGTTPTAELDLQRPCRRSELRPRPIVRQARRLRALHAPTTRLRRTLRRSRAGWGRTIRSRRSPACTELAADCPPAATLCTNTCHSPPRAVPPTEGARTHHRRQEWPVPRPAAAMPTPARNGAVAPDASAADRTASASVTPRPTPWYVTERFSAPRPKTISSGRAGLLICCVIVLVVTLAGPLRAGGAACGTELQADCAGPLPRPNTSFRGRAALLISAAARSHVMLSAFSDPCADA